MQQRGQDVKVREFFNGHGRPFTAGTAIGAVAATLGIFIALQTCQEKRDAGIGTRAAIAATIDGRLHAVEKHVSDMDPLRERFISLESSVNGDLKAVNAQLELLSRDLAHIQSEQAAQRQLLVQLLARIPAGGRFGGGTK